MYRQSVMLSDIDLMELEALHFIAEIDSRRVRIPHILPELGDEILVVPDWDD